jgi:hypothetical protein
MPNIICIEPPEVNQKLTGIYTWKPPEVDEPAVIQNVYSEPIARGKVTAVHGNRYDVEVEEVYEMS